MKKWWIVAAIGFIAISALMICSLAAPRWMMGQSNANLWIREPLMLGLIAANQLAVSSYMALMIWLDPTKER